jgi:hypothetical protein
MDLDEFTSAAWQTAVATGVGYVILLVALTVLLFVIPTLVFALL